MVAAGVGEGSSRPGAGTPSPRAAAAPVPAAGASPRDLPSRFPRKVGRSSGVRAGRFPAGLPRAHSRPLSAAEVAGAARRASQALARVNRRWASAQLGMSQGARGGPVIGRPARGGAIGFPSPERRNLVPRLPRPSARLIHPPPPLLTPCAALLPRLATPGRPRSPRADPPDQVGLGPFSLDATGRDTGGCSPARLPCPPPGASPSSPRPAPRPAPSPPVRSYKEALMARLAGDGQPRPKKASPADQHPRPALSARGHALEEGFGAGSSRSERGGSDREGRSPEYYAGTSLRLPPPPRDPERDPRLPLPGSPGDVRRREAARLSPPDVDREYALRAELVARPPPAPRSRDEHAPRDVPARPPAPRASAPAWRRDRPDHRPEERRDRPDHRPEERRAGPPSRPGAELRRSDWRPSRAEGADWRREDGPSRRTSPVLPPVAPSAAPSMGKKKKKKSKKKRAAGATPVGDDYPAPQGVPEQEAPEPPARAPPPPRCPTTLPYLGYGTERWSFYFVDAEIEEEVVRPHLVTVTLAPEQATPAGLVISADLIREELAAYIGDFRDSSFAWEVTETAPLVFSVPFPSAELLRVCSHDFIRCPINKFMISVKVAATEPDPVPPLEKVWVLVYGLPRGVSAAPRGGKLTHILKAISEPVGNLITADLASFEDDGPAHIEILCPAPAEIDGLSLVFYFGSKGRRLTFELESPVLVDPLGVDPDDQASADGGLDDKGGSSEEGLSSEGEEDVGGAQPESSAVGRIPATSAAGPAGHAGCTPVVALVVDTGCPLPVTAIPAVAAEEEVSMGLKVCPASSPRSPGVVCYSCSLGSPRLPPSGPRTRAPSGR
ncbi:hypothetical protein ZWY2020_010694 [Hordeum vulgare]|nr:hypothetical protein ZWY2020_010694 [Hordeum vulgare]